VLSEVGERSEPTSDNTVCNTRPVVQNWLATRANFGQRKSIYEEGELKAQKFNSPQKSLKSTSAQI
jgi:hypothetical protein